MRGVVGPWFEVGGANVVLSLILNALGWLVVVFEAPLKETSLFLRRQEGTLSTLQIQRRASLLAVRYPDEAGSREKQAVSQRRAARMGKCSY